MVSATVTIRKAKLSDLRAIKRINERNLPENYSYEYWLETFDKNNAKQHSFVASVSGELIGYIYATSTTVMSFAVDMEYRRTGVGKQLLACCLNTFNKDVDLYVRMSNETARNLYKSFDFVDNSIIEKYYEDEDACNMIHKYTGKKLKENLKFTINYEKMEIKLDNDIESILHDDNCGSEHNHFHDIAKRLTNLKSVNIKSNMKQIKPTSC